MASRWGSWRDHHPHLVRAVSVTMVVGLLQAAGGFAFWLLAARLTSSAAVGAAAALASASAFVMFATSFGLVPTIARLVITDSQADRRRFAFATWLTFATSSAGAVVYWALLGNPAPSSGDGPAVLLAFVGATAAVSVSLLVDVRLLALRRLRVLVVRTAVAVVARSALLLFLPSEGHRLFLFLAATGPDVAVGLLGAAWLNWGARERPAIDGAPERGRLVRYASFAYVSALAMNGAPLALPVIVLRFVTDSSFGSFYVAWGIAGVVFLIPRSAMLGLQVEGGRGDDDLARQLRLAIWISVGLTAVCLVASLLGGSLISKIYGEDFRAAADLLPWFVAGAIPWGVTQLFLAEARVRFHDWFSVALAALSGVGCLVPVWILTQASGVRGAALAWAFGTAGSSAIVAVLRWRRNLPVALTQSPPTTTSGSPARTISAQAAVGSRVVRRRAPE